MYKLPEDAFEKLEKAARSHEPHRVVNPSKSWGLDFDIFDDYDWRRICEIFGRLSFLKEEKLYAN